RDTGAVRPGDFAQTRDIGSPKGHAFQVWEVEARGDAIAGLEGSPEVVTPGRATPHAPSGGTLQQGAVFRIGPTTAPETIRSAYAIRWSVIESNIADAT